MTYFDLVPKDLNKQAGQYLCDFRLEIRTANNPKNIDDNLTFYMGTGMFTIKCELPFQNLADRFRFGNYIYSLLLADTLRQNIHQEIFLSINSNQYLIQISVGSFVEQFLLPIEFVEKVNNYLRDIAIKIDKKNGNHEAAKLVEKFIAFKAT